MTASGTWACPSCGDPNEPHAIFCSNCGVSRYIAPERDDARAEPPVVEHPKARPPEFQGTVAGFTGAWTLACLGAGLGSGLFDAAASFGIWSFGSAPWGATAARIASEIASALVYGGLTGSLQCWILRRWTRRPGWSGWILATAGGYLVSSVASTLMPNSMWASTSLPLRMTVSALAGLIAGGFLGVLQSRVLSRLTGPGGWGGWVAVTAGLHSITYVISPLVWHLALADDHIDALRLTVATVTYFVFISGIFGLVGGFVLARMLGRRSAARS